MRRSPLPPPRTWRWALAGLLAAASAQAFNPPYDTAGPLAVRIQGPDVVTQLETPLSVQVVVENSGAAAVNGTIELGVIDHWRAAPGRQTFSVGPKEKSSVEFTVAAGRGTYSAHYPIHAIARFEWGGKQHVAHPIFILQTKLPAPPAASAAVEWRAVEIPAHGRLGLWMLPVRRTVVQVFGEQPLVMPVGWQGSEARSRASTHVGAATLAAVTREAIAMHPPWFEGHAGTVIAEFPLRLPAVKPLRLEFAHAVQPEGNGDGVTFRVRVLPLAAPEGELGKVVFERHAAAKSWQPGAADLEAYAGEAVRLQLESHPGPKNDTSFDLSYWAEPTLVMGTPPAAPAFPPADLSAARLLGSAGSGPAQYEVRVRPGQRRLLDAAIGFVRGDTRLWMQGFEVRVLDTWLHDPRAPLFLVEAREETCPAGYQVRHRFAGPGAAFDLVARLWVERGVLRAKFHLEGAPPAQPWRVVHLQETSAGPWSHAARQVYAGQGNVLREPEAFRLDFDGHRLATSFVGLDFTGGPSLVMGSDLPPTCLEVRPGDRMYALRVPHEVTLTFIPCPNVWEGVQAWRDVNGLKAAGGVATAAGRFVFDLWGGRYDQSAQALRHAFRYGLTDAMMIWHNWQRWGYDYRLPDICPPNPELGTLEEMQGLLRACRAAGVIAAVHDNYIDFYPDADEFSYDRQICCTAPGQPQRAWLNEWRGAQSYRYRADRIEPLLRRNLEWVRQQLAPTGYFIDVWSSAGPYDYWTADGQFFSRVFTRDTWGRHFAWIRDTLGGSAPQISESGHDQLIGSLDGAQANHLRVGKPLPDAPTWFLWDIRCADAERTPWLDAAHHDRFVLHGAGYPGRYEGGLAPNLHGIYSDDYLATEVLTGHPAMVAQPFGRDVVRKYWLLHGLGRALALHTIDRVEYAGDDLHRQHVFWKGGGEVWVNRGESEWTPSGVTLPQYGFLARIPTAQGPLEVSLARRDGIIVEMARSADELYVNGRKPSGGPLRIGVKVEKVRSLGDREFELTLVWQADDPVPAGWSPFLHVVDDRGEILFQAGHRLGVFAADRQGNFTATARGRFGNDIAPGRALELRWGIYHPEDGQRLELAGVDDGTRRIRLGTLALEGPAQQPTGVAWTPRAPEVDPLLARQNAAGRPVDFGPLVTAGACRLTRDAQTLLLTPLPQRAGEKFEARLRWSALGWPLPEPNGVALVSEEGKVLARTPVRREGDQIVIECPAEAFACRCSRE